MYYHGVINEKNNSYEWRMPLLMLRDLLCPKATRPAIAILEGYPIYGLQSGRMLRLSKAETGIVINVRTLPPHTATYFRCL
ncbi:hypothetical protein BC792_10776 [Sphingobacterium allocomposti]|uniref:Uncharacterized protein n=1 Tax=Sphingobacterium allocomposti TaxID=415956 RepID=A0A5S5DJU4_9SPHI|nr:hypothetical protein BC792_10776 [Sphingobacterium composti Yoo et al. 2007 non Ten et al. 2007]